MPGRSYAVDQLVAAGRALDRLGVAAVQAGFPAADERHATAVRRLAGETDATVAGLARALPGDVDAVAEAEADAVHLFASVSDPMLAHVFDKPREAVVGSIADALDRADHAGLPARLGLMDGFRTDPAHVIAVAERFPEVPIGLADTVGERTPVSVDRFLDDLAGGGVDLSRLGVHFHDDLGVATANTLAAYRAGVHRADVSVASIGERAGNAPLEQLVVAGTVEHDEGFGVDAGELVPACRAVLEALGESVPPRRPVLGEEVVSHESGIHTAVMLEEPWVFEPFDPARFGGERRLVFGESTGRGAAGILLERAGREPTDGLIDALLDRLAAAGPTDLDGALSLAADVEA